MYVFRQSLIEICKTFLASIACSVVFALMIYRESALPSKLICLVLNGAALLLFLYINYFNWSRLCRRTYSAVEYYVPTLAAILVYIAITIVAYLNRIGFYMWLFLPTRFLEPMLNRDYAFLSVCVTYLAMFAVAFITPPLSRR